MRKNKKLAIIGAGNAACITALHFYRYSRDLFDEIAIYYDLSQPIERVGQGATLTVPRLLFEVLGINWYNQLALLEGTRKDGILYENWGVEGKKFIHAFPLGECSIHYVPQLLSKLVLNCGLFTVINQKITHPEEEIDADYIFDCRGRHNRDENLYEPLVNPLNSVLLGRIPKSDPNLHYTRCVASPDGWTFVIPNYDSTSFGYLYNNNITTKNQAAETFTNMFDVVSEHDLTFQNYIAKSFFEGKRTILNGNRGSFLEPLEATSLGFYHKICRFGYDHIVNGVDKETCNRAIREEMFKIQKFILWHYQFGSIFDTPFWTYAKSLSFTKDTEFSRMLSEAKTVFSPESKSLEYAQWPVYSFNNWITHVKGRH